jgi:hypothetical protein
LNSGLAPTKPVKVGDALQYSIFEEVDGDYVERQVLGKVLYIDMVDLSYGMQRTKEKSGLDRVSIFTVTLPLIKLWLKPR